VSAEDRSSLPQDVINVLLGKDVPNDTGLPPERVADILNREGVKLTYGQMTVVVQACDYRRARDDAAQLPEAERPKVLESVVAALDANLPKVASGQFDRKTANDFYADVMLWHALKSGGAN